MKIFLSILSFALALNLNAQWQNTSFIGIHEGVAAFDESTFGMVEANGVKFTSNGGDDFTTAGLLDTDGLEIAQFIPTDLEYASENTLYCTGYFITNQYEGILKSINGGFNWEYVYDAASLGPDLQLNDLHIASNGDIYAVGKAGKVLKSENEGNSWTTQFISGAGDLYQVFALDENHVSVGGIGGLFTSTNGGQLWDNEVTSDPITGISYNGSNSIMACTADDEILFSSDGGAQWSTQAFDFVNLVDVTYYEDNTWFLGSSTELYRSDDNGETWFIQPTILTFASLFQLKHRNGMLIGRRQNSVLYTSEPSPVPTDYVVLNAVTLPEDACGEVLPFTLNVDNLGSNEVTDLLIAFSIDGEFVANIEWNGLLSAQSSNSEIFLEITTGITTAEQVFEFQLTQINGNTNEYLSEGVQDIAYVGNNIQGVVVIGPSGDFSSLTDFVETVDSPSLCGDLLIQFENGTYEGEFVDIDPQGYKLTVEALDELNPNVTILNGVWFSGDNSEESELIFRNIDANAEEEFVDPVKLTSFPLIEIINVHCSAPIGGNQNGIDLNSDSSYVEGCSFTGGNTGIRFNGGESQSINIQNTVFQSNNNGVFVWQENETITINQCTFDIGNYALGINEAKYVIFSNNRCYGSNSAGTMVDANTTEADSNEPRIQFFNNVIEHHHPHMLVGRGSARVLNNVFIRLGVENSFGPAIIIQNNTQADIEIKNNIFQMGNALLGNFVSSNILNQNPGITDYNAYYATSDSPFGITNPNQFDTLEEYFENWQEVRQQDLNSVILEVEFDPETPGKPLLNANNAGLVDASDVAGPAIDLAGNLRSIPNDFGAYELQSLGLDANLVELQTQSDCLGNMVLSALVSNASPIEITQLNFTWSIDGEEQPEVEWTGSILPSDNLAIELGSLFYDEVQSVLFEAQLAEVNNGEEEPLGNNQSSLNHSTYSGEAVFHVGEDQEYETFEEVMTILSEEGMCGAQEIILHPGTYTPLASEFNLESGFEDYPLYITSSTQNAEDVNLDFGDQEFVMTGFKNVHFDYLTLNSVSDTVLVIPSEFDSLEIQHCIIGGLIFLDEPFNSPQTAEVHVTNTLFNGSSQNGITNSGNSGLAAFIFNDNVINNNAFTTWVVDIQKTEYAEVKRNDVNSISFVGMNFAECREGVISENQLSYRFGAAVQYTCPDDGSSNLTFENNLIQSSAGPGSGLLFTGASPEQSTLYFNHNTARDGNRTVQVLDATSVILNNIMSATERAVQLNTLASESTTIDGNIYSMAADIPVVGIGNETFSLSEWQLASDQDVSSIQQEVVFISDEGYLTEDPIVDGLMNGIAQGGVSSSDIEGNPRDAGFPDVGCYEFGEIPTLFGMDVLSFEMTNEGCGAPYETSIAFSNSGDLPITNFTYTILIEDLVYEASWEGTLAIGEEITLELASFNTPLSPIIEADVVVSSINGQSENIATTDLLAVEIDAQSLSGVVVIGNAPQAHFNTPQELIDFIEVVGICGTIQALIQPGVYSEMFISELNLNGFELTISSLLQDNSSVLISGEYGLRSLSSDGITFESVSFASTTGTASIENANSGGSFDDCSFASTSEASLEMVNSASYQFTECTFTKAVSVATSNDVSLEACELSAPISFADSRNVHFHNNAINNSNEIDDALACISLSGDLGESEISSNSVSSIAIPALHINNCDCDPNEITQIHNNLFSTTNGTSAVQINDGHHIDLIYNTVKSENGLALSVAGSSTLQLVNNIFVSQNASAAEITDPSVAMTFITNIFYAESETEFGNYDSVDDFNNTGTLNAFDNVEIDPALDASSYAITNAEALGLGTVISTITTDLYSNPRSETSPTCGAIENIAIDDLLGDLNGDGQIGIDDLLLILGGLGCTSDCGNLDIDGDGIVGMGDLLIILGVL